jgi:tryptophan-rich sensory protein
MPERDARKGLAPQTVALGICFAACLSAAGLGSIATAPALGTWYAGLVKPPWNPPNWIFGPVWTTLYAMMAVAAWLVWRGGGPKRFPALTLFCVQLALNVSWSWLFFGLRQPGLALAEILLLWLAIGATAWAFGRLSRPAAILFIPYLLWVGFAAVLNWTLWRLNT